MAELGDLHHLRLTLVGADHYSVLLQNSLSYGASEELLGRVSTCSASINAAYLELNAGVKLAQLLEDRSGARFA